MRKYHGLFWYCGENDGEPILLCRKIPWEDAETKLNHQKEWAAFNKRITQGHPYNYYPRGRVEIASQKVIIFLNSNLCEDNIVSAVKREFELTDIPIPVQIVADGSKHYQAVVDDLKKERERFE